jgi:hypothetical protein
MQNSHFRFLSATAAVMTFGLSMASSATLSSVPMQGAMAMPMVSYHSGDGAIHVMMPGEIPQLTPLMVSNPSDNFDPSDPWFDALDPSRQGASFSRRYGWVMDAMSESLPANTQMWIRKLSGSPELKAYRYSSSAPKALAPIFGTDGSTNAMFWNAMMFHPVFAAPPGTNSLSASFEVYLVDKSTGKEVPGSSSGAVEFLWNNVHDGRPALSLARKIVIGWPSGTATNWVLETAASSDAAQWTAITNSPTTVDGQPSVILDSNPAQKYFRMRRQP